MAEDQVNRMLFNDENSQAMVNRRRLQSMGPCTSNSDSLTPVRKQPSDGANTIGAGGDMSTPRPMRNRASPLTSSGEDYTATPPEPTAPLKEKCKSDPRKSSNGFLHLNANPDAKCLKFEDEKSLVPLNNPVDRKGLKSAGAHRCLPSSSKGGQHKETVRTPKKGTIAWVDDAIEENKNNSISDKIPLISGFNVYVSSPDPMSKFHEHVNSVISDDFEMASSNISIHSPKKHETMSQIVKKLHSELDSPPDTIKSQSHKTKIIKNQVSSSMDDRYLQRGNNKMLVMSTETRNGTDVSPDGIAGLFNETVSPFKSNYKAVTKLMHTSLNNDLKLEGRQDCISRDDYGSELRPATSPAKSCGIAVTPERKSNTRGSRPKPHIIQRKKISTSHIGNTESVDCDRAIKNSPVPSAPIMGKFRKKLNINLSPLTEGPYETGSPADETESPKMKHQDEPYVPFDKLSLCNDFNGEVMKNEETASSSISAAPIHSSSIEFHVTETITCIQEEESLKIVNERDYNTMVKPSRPSEPPTAKGKRPIPSRRVRDAKVSGTQESSLIAEGHMFEALRSKEVSQRYKTHSTIDEVAVCRMKFVPMPRRKANKAEKPKFSPRLEHISENEESFHSVPRWLTILRKRSHQTRLRSRGRNTPIQSKILDESDSSLLSSTILLISDGVVMDGVEEDLTSPLDESPNEATLHRVAFSVAKDDVCLEEESQRSEIGEEYKVRLASYFNSPEGVSQVEDYAGFDCIFNRYGADLKSYVDSHENIQCVVDASGNTLLHAAAYIGWDRAVKFLIRRGVPLNQPNHFGITALVYAIEFENFEARDYMMRKGAQVTI